MKKIPVKPAASFCMVFFLFLLTGCGDNSEHGVTTAHSLYNLKHSHIALMESGEIEDINLLRSIQPSVVAWGSDPVGSLDDLASFRERLSQYKELGIDLQASNAWMLTATPAVLYHEPQYRDAVCVDIGGLPIVPPWLDGTYKGVPSYWGCSNHPLFRSQVKERVIAGISSGANMQHVDDHLGTFASSLWAGGCFCDHCMEGFRKWLIGKYSEQELRDKGIKDPGSFLYADQLKALGISSREGYLSATGRGEVPLREEFLDFQRESAADFIRQLGMVADSSAGKDIPLGINAWNLEPTQLSTSHHADYFSNEVQHYDHEDSIPPVVYMLGTALGKPVFATGSGEDWVHAQLDKSITRVQRWIATAYSFGHYFMYSHNQWGFSEETGTMWYKVPISIYEPLCRFITKYAELFDGYEAVIQVGILYDNAACRDGDWWVREISRQLLYENIPIGLAIEGDKHLRFSTDTEHLSGFDLLMVPGYQEPTKELNDLVKAATEQGKLMVWKGNEELLSKIDPLVNLTHGAKVWTLPRQKITEHGTELVIHLLNQDYDQGNDRMNMKSDVEVFVSKRLTGSRTAETAWIYAPGNYPEELEISQVEGGIRLMIPVIDLWAIIAFEFRD